MYSLNMVQPVQPFSLLLAFCKFLSCDDSRFCLIRGPASSLVFCLLRDDFLLTPSEGHYHEVSKRANEKLLEEHLGEAPGQLGHEARNR